MSSTRGTFGSYLPTPCARAGGLSGVGTRSPVARGCSLCTCDVRLHAVAVCAHALAGRDVLGRLMLALALELADSSSESLAAHRTSLELGVVGPRAPGTDLRRHGGVCVVRPRPRAFR